MGFEVKAGVEVVTETGEFLGWVKRLNLASHGQVSTIAIASSRLSWLTAGLISVYEISADEIISSASRLLLSEGAEERIHNSTIGVLGRLGIGKPLWKQKQKGYITSTRTDHDLGDWRDEAGGMASTRPKRPTPFPNDAAATLD